GGVDDAAFVVAIGFEFDRLTNSPVADPSSDFDFVLQLLIPAIVLLAFDDDVFERANLLRYRAGRRVDHAMGAFAEVIDDLVPEELFRPRAERSGKYGTHDCGIPLSFAGLVTSVRRFFSLAPLNFALQGVSPL